MRTFCIGILSTLVLALSVPSALAFSSGPPDGVAGDPPGNYNCTFCHNSFPVNSGSGSVGISGLPANYTPGNVYTLTVTTADPSALRWGFELTALDNANAQAGTFAITDPTHTQLSDHAADSADYVKQTSTGTYPGTTTSGSWNFDWTAPSGGDVTFYVAGNGANYNGFNTLDYIYTTSATVSSVSYPSFILNLTYLSGSPVPAGGGNLFFDIFLQNVSGAAQSFDAWLATEYEGGPPTTVVLRSLVNFQSGGLIDRPNMFFPVPGAWAAGNYMMYGRCGLHPDVVWNEDSFPFSKSGVSDGNAFVPFVPENVPDIFGEIDTGSGLPADKFNLVGNYPNPFNPTTTINFNLANADHVTLAVYDLSGRLVETLVDGYRDVGTHQVTFDVAGLASGMYIYRLISNGRTVAGKMMLMK